MEAEKREQSHGQAEARGSRVPEAGVHVVALELHISRLTSSFWPRGADECRQVNENPPTDRSLGHQGPKDGTHSHSNLHRGGQAQEADADRKDSVQNR